MPARRCLPILHLAGKASIRRRPVNSALGVRFPPTPKSSLVVPAMRLARSACIAATVLVAAANAVSAPTSYDAPEITACTDQDTDLDRMNCLASLLEASDGESTAREEIRLPTFRSGVSTLVPVPTELVGRVSIRPTRKQYTEEEYREIDRQFVPRAKRNVLVLLNSGGQVTWRDLVVSSRILPVLCGQVRVQSNPQVSVDYKRFVATSEPRLVAIDSQLIAIQDLWNRLCPRPP